MMTCVVSFAAGKKGSGEEPIRIILAKDIEKRGYDWIKEEADKKYGK